LRVILGLIWRGSDLEVHDARAFNDFSDFRDGVLSNG
jgi:hypothetical protein